MRIEFQRTFKKAEEIAFLKKIGIEALTFESNLSII